MLDEGEVEREVREKLGQWSTGQEPHHLRHEVVRKRAERHTQKTTIITKTTTGRNLPIYE